MLTLLAVLAIAIGVLSPVSAGAASPTVNLGGDKTVVESAYGSYIVVMKADPLIVEFGQDGLTSKAADKKAKGLARGHDKALTDAGLSASDKVQSYTNALNGFSALLSFEEAQAVANQVEVAMVLPDELLQADTDSSPTFIGLTDPAGAWQTGYDGEGVVIGVIDTGVWPEHPSFADDGTYNAPLITLSDDERPTCEFGNSVHNANDADFECNNKLIGARQMLDTYRALIGATPTEYDSARDDNGHGTHTASTAGGNAGVEASIFGIDRGTVSGIAPRAHIVAYKGLGTLGGFGSDLAAAIDQAVFDGVDVINYSIGSPSFAVGPDDIAFLFAAAEGVFIATSNGNAGPGVATTGSPASVPWLTAVGASTQARTFQGSAILGDGSEFFGASVTVGTGPHVLVDAAAAGDELCNIGVLDANVVAGNIVLCKRGAIARVAKGEAVALAGGVGMILYNANDAQSQVTDTHFVPSVHINNTDGLVVKAYIVSAGATATATITEGAFAPAQGSVMAAFSSRGPNRLSADIIRPDVTAPGVNILAGNTPTPEPGNVAGELFQSISGTSMSSPHVAGLFALIKQAHPDWSAAMAKSAIMTTARQDVFKEDGVTAADAFDMGAGHVDPGEAVHKGSSFQPGLAYDAGLFEYAGYTCGADLGVFTAGSCVFLEAIGVPTDAADLNVPSIGIADIPGSQTVQRTVTSVAQESGWRTYNVSVDAPAGFEVTVSPSTISLKKGQSATYYVTVTNVSAPAGDWRHGSLTWTDTTGNYDVYSPIAVSGALFDAPDTVTGSGESGSASFDVAFGYTGSYSAAAHGLVPAAVTNANVLQDPDQSFDPSDGFSNQHDIAVSGAALLRVAIPPEATEANADLDIFLFNPSGGLEATSTNGGTDELIDIVMPADGTWTLFVQGWSAPGGDSDYDLYSWVISATPGGNLTVDSAPASATVGATETIDVSWTGATLAEWHLGAVSHTGDVGLMGFTLVEIDNR